jgi:SAM-dependent methyltransferase
VYQRIADEYASIISTKDTHAYYERPTTLSMLPEVRGKRVLDAGCGPGVYSEWLLDHGANVLAVDYSEKMVALTTQRTRGHCDVRCADLAAGLGFIEDASIDLVLAPLVLDYVLDWESLFKEFHRFLVEDGLIVFSCRHPCFGHQGPPITNYFAIQERYEVWRSGFQNPVQMPYYHRSLTEMMVSIIGAGFTIEQLVEAKPTEDLEHIDGAFYQRLLREPIFIHMRVRKAIQPSITRY